MSDLFEDEKLDTVRLLHLVYRNWKLLLITAILGFGGAVAITTQIPPTYYSHGIIYAPATNSSSAILENPQFGYEIHADRLMQILDSEVIRDSVINQFDLINYYKLDTTKIGWEHTLLKNYSRDVSFFRSKYMSIVIKSTTESAELSANIVNGIIDMVDGVHEGIFKENMRAAFDHAEETYNRKLEEIDELVDSLQGLQLRSASASLSINYDQYKAKSKVVREQQNKLTSLQNKYQFVELRPRLSDLQGDLEKIQNKIELREGELKILEPTYGEKDTAVVNRKAELEGLRRSKESKQERISQLTDVLDQYEILTTSLNSEIDHLNRLREEYEDASNVYDPMVESTKITRLRKQLDLELENLAEVKAEYETALDRFEAPFPTVLTINRARPADRKSGPSFMLNAMLGTAGALVMVLLFLLLRVKFRQVKAEIKKLENGSARTQDS